MLQWFSLHKRKLIVVSGLALSGGIYLQDWHNFGQKSRFPVTPQTQDEKALQQPKILSSTQKNLIDASKPDYDCIICGAGTAGCIIAYFLAKWMEDLNVPGRILLLERGAPYIHPEEYAQRGPHPSINNWFENWGAFAISHDTEAINDAWYPYSASSHFGVGGCGAHDTRISFVPSGSQCERYSSMLNLSRHEFDTYIQTILNLIPIDSAASFSEKFFDEVIDTLSRNEKLISHNYKSQITPNSIGYAPIAIFPDETRWTSAYLMEDGIRPANLDVITGASVDKVLLSDDPTITKAQGVSVVLSDGTSREYHLSQTGEVVLAGGSLGVPSILQRSGIGPPELLNRLGIEVRVANDEVGHGVDHIETGIVYDYLDKWNNADGKMPRGGPMNWPLVLFKDFDDESNETKKSFYMCHFGISPPPYHLHDVIATVNVTQPNELEGFRLYIKSKDPLDHAQVIHSAHDEDFKMMAKGILKTIHLFQVLQEHSVVGNRVQPPLSINIDVPFEEAAKNLDDWMRNNTGTVYHWMSTCKSGVEGIGSVADENFVVRDGDGGVIQNLRIGSGACLPQIPEANPHMSISAFSVALAHKLLMEQSKRQNVKYNQPGELQVASEFIKKNGEFQVNDVNGVKPDLREIARKHRELFGE